MSQILHIFRKDSRTFWPEILVTLAVTAGYVAVYSISWKSRVSYGGAQALIEAFSFLVLIAWYLLITRVVHAESLIGDNRAWLTRPYEWPKLLAAKLLFIAAYLCVPLLIAQCILLRLAGFHPLLSSHGLLYNLGQLALFLMLPIFTIAVITSNFARMTLTLIGVLVGFFCLNIFAQLKGYRLYGDQSPSAFWLLLCFVVCCSAIVLQYATRRTLLVRLLLIAVLGVTGIVEYAFPHSVDVSEFYASPSSVSAMTGHISSPGRNHGAYGGGIDPQKRQGLQIPIEATGVPDGYAMDLEDVQFSIDAPGGFHWDSTWQKIPQVRFSSGTGNSSIYIWIDRDVFDRLKSAPIDLHLKIAVILLQAGAATSMRLPAQEFTVPNFAICSESGRDSQTYLRCRSPIREPSLTLINVRWSETPCSGYRPVPDIASTDEWRGNVDRTPAEASLPSVSVFDLNFGGQTVTRSGSGPMELALCPGTPITFTSYHVAQRTHVDLTIDGLHLPEVVTSPNGN
jgi:hypothetical protein